MSFGRSPKTKSTTSPWSGQIPYLTGTGEGDNPLGIFPAASTAYGATPKTPYSGSYFAGPDWRQLGAIDFGTNVAQGLAGQGDALGRVGQDTASGRYLDPSTNPAFGGWLQAAFNPLLENFQRNIIPSLTEGRIQSGAYEYGPREAIAEGLASSDLTRQMGDLSAQAAFGLYNTERDRQLAAGTQIQEAANLNLQPAQILAALGGQMQGFDQVALNEALQQYQAGLAAPWQGLPEYSGIIQGNYGGNTTTSGGGPSMGSEILSGLLGATALGVGVGDLGGWW